jgi:hypothetical protein
MSQPPPVGIRPTFSSLTGVDDLAAIEALTGTGIAARTGTNTWALRTLQQPAAGITITNPAGTAGDPTLALANDLAALEGLSSTGMIARTGDGTAAVRTITGTADRVTITDGNGVSGNPTADIASTYVGQTSITTLGTVATGTWNATTIGVSKGGTGLTATPGNGEIDIGNGSGFTRTTLTAGSNVSITNGAGSITIAASVPSSTVGAPNTLLNGGFDVWQRGSLVFGSAITGDTTSGSATVSNVSSVASLSVGMSLSGTGITAGTTVASIVSSTSFTMSANATATGSSVAIYPGVDDNMSTGADRWIYLSDGTQLNGLGERVSNTGLSVYAGKFQNRTSGRCGIIQWIDAKNSRPLRSKSLYFGCKVYADNSAITVRCAIIGWSGTDDTLGASRDPVNDWTSGTFTTGNFFKSTSFSVIATGSVTTSNTYETLSCSGTASSVITNLAVLVWKDAANTTPLTVAEADLYNGSTSRTFTPVATAHELAECERFFYKTFALGTQPVANAGAAGSNRFYTSYTTGGYVTNFRQRMHRVPTLVVYNPGSASTGTFRNATAGSNLTAVPGTATDHCVVIGSSAATADNEYQFHLTADAEIA